MPPTPKKREVKFPAITKRFGLKLVLAFAVLSEDAHGKTIWTFYTKEKAEEFYKQLKEVLKRT